MRSELVEELVAMRGQLAPAPREVLVEVERIVQSSRGKSLKRISRAKRLTQAGDTSVQAPADSIAEEELQRLKQEWAIVRQSLEQQLDAALQSEVGSPSAC